MSSANEDLVRVELDALREELFDVEKRLDDLKCKNMQLKSSNADLKQQNVRLLIINEMKAVLTSPQDQSTSSDMSSDELITKLLVEFDDVSYLQENNQKLLLLVRDLSGKLEEKENTIASEAIKTEAALRYQTQVIELCDRQKNRFKDLYYDAIKDRTAKSKRAGDMAANSLDNTETDKGDRNNETIDELEGYVNKQRTLRDEYDDNVQRECAAARLQNEQDQDKATLMPKTEVSLKKMIEDLAEAVSLSSKVGEDRQNYKNKLLAILNQIIEDTFLTPLESESMIAQAKYKIEELQNIVDQRTAEVEQLKRDYYASNAKCDQLNKTVAEWEADSKKQHAIFEEYRTKMEAKISAAQLSETNAKSCVKEMETENVLLSDQLQKVQTERNEFLIQISGKDVQLRERHADCERLQSALQSIEQNNEMMHEAYKEKLNRAQDQIQKLQNELNSKADLLKSHQEETVSFRQNTSESYIPETRLLMDLQAQEAAFCVQLKLLEANLATAANIDESLFNSLDSPNASHSDQLIGVIIAKQAILKFENIRLTTEAETLKQELNEAYTSTQEKLLEKQNFSDELIAVKAIQQRTASELTQKEDKIKKITDDLAAVEVELISTKNKEEETKKIAKRYKDSFAIHTAKIEELENALAAQPLPDRFLPACQTELIAPIQALQEPHKQIRGRKRSAEDGSSDDATSLDSIAKSTRLAENTSFQAAFESTLPDEHNIPTNFNCDDNSKVTKSAELHDAITDEGPVRYFKDGADNGDSLEIEVLNHQEHESVGSEIDEHYIQYDDNEEVKCMNDRNKVVIDSIYAGLSDVGDDALADRSEIQDEIGTDDMNSDSEKVVQVGKGRKGNHSTQPLKRGRRPKNSSSVKRPARSTRSKDPQTVAHIVQANQSQGDNGQTQQRSLRDNKRIQIPKRYQRSNIR